MPAEKTEQRDSKLSRRPAAVFTRCPCALSLAALLPATVQRNCTDSESSQSDEFCERSGGV